jgi:glyoxylase-like metal-dependent hydrolase (beta-lactamase superfamily II)
MENHIELDLGFTNVQLLKCKDGYIQMDAGYKANVKKYLNLLKKNNIEPNEIKLIIANHAHFDHVGGLRKLKEITNAKVLAHEIDAEYLRKGSSVEPKPINFIVKLLFKLIPQALKYYDPIEPDIIIKDEYSLEEYGVKAKVIHTPGHTLGTISLITEDGIAFIGCCAHGFPLRLNPGLPTVAEDINQVYSSWERLLEEGVQKVYISHGKAVSVAKMRKILEKKRS